ncbi:MAG TPA: MATE family efflux transporter [Gemmataceae bacterium]|nr:MATE family efflux transporter [Gemmataceae bacterium]
MERSIEPSLTAPGSTRELLRLAWPLILSNSIWMVQIILDRILLSRASLASLAAGFSSAMLFWAFLILFQFTANYATTFVAQYTGAGRPERVGPVVWQAIWFSLVVGVAFQILQPLAGWIVALCGHATELQGLETAYFRCLCMSALPTLVSAAATSFFTGRGDSRTVLLINVTGLAVNALVAAVLIFGLWGFPALGIVGAGLATVLGTGTSAILALLLMLQAHYRKTHATASGWRFDRELFGRLMRFGVPNGVFAALDVLGYTIFLQLIGRLGEVDLIVTTIAFTLNLVVYFPMMGIGQAVEVLVGQRLGEDRPDLAERTTWRGLQLALAYASAGALAYVLFPETLAGLFHGSHDGELWEPIRTRVPVLLRFVAVYSLFDTMNVLFSNALRGAGDTRFVTWAALLLSWPVMIVPTWAALEYGWDLYWAWAFASGYIILLALTFWFRFHQGKWRSMRVIEAS